MPAQGGSPRVRHDLRIGSQTTLEIVGTSSALIIEPFGALAIADLDITKSARNESWRSVIVTSHEPGPPRVTRPV
ncbi:hypothetical protein [Streptomyces sp. P9(2023)]|uniref:hypothetical protein n=1 Tax=Streptomyces sp. P9(2023) TaxID=3064394 RepID=UPI0028F416AA|nr:hypothetical protein [Streptomyces sp. P9(2023)]